MQENNVARAVVRVAGAFRVLCVTPGGRQDRLTRSLTSAGLSVAVHAPATAPLTLDALDGIRAVVLENVPIQDLPSGAARALHRYVQDLGGGLLMTGGRSSFGPGGYHHSLIEDVLPVSMEVREEHRKFSLAMAIALDRSGSMAMSVAGGVTKMDLANLGAVAAIELLNAQDVVSVVAVDSAPHVVVPLTSVRNKQAIAARVRSIESMGGGIFTFAALQAAAMQLKDASQGTKHIVIFADANDAEQPGSYKAFVPKLRAAGVTVSVIGLGKDTDADADFLRDVARLGGGRCFFGEDPSDLPRMFAQETLQVARSSWVDEPTAADVAPDIVSVGALAGTDFPVLGGYSIAYLKPGAQRGLVTRDDTGAPLLAFWQSGLGRSAAFLGEVDGAASGGLAAWNGYADFFSTVLRWVAGTEATRAVYAEVTRRGHDAVLRVEVEPGRQDLLTGLEARVVRPDGSAHTAMLTRSDDTSLEARIPLPTQGAYRPVLRMADGSFLRLPAVTLPYSPEFEPRARPDEGEAMLRDLVQVAAGTLDPRADQILAGSRRSTGRTPLGSWLAWTALGLLLLEIAVRRLQWQVPTGAASRALRRARPERRKAPPMASAPTGEDASPPDKPETAPPSEERAGIASTLERARRRKR